MVVLVTEVIDGNILLNVTPDAVDVLDAFPDKSTPLNEMLYTALFTSVGAFVSTPKDLEPAFNSAPVRATVAFEAALPPVLVNVTVPLDNASESEY